VKYKPQAELAGIHGNPESNNNQRPWARQAAWKGKGPTNRGGWVWDLYHSPQSQSPPPSTIE